MEVISLFSGAGGFDLGLINAGHNIVWANDIYLDAAETYERNLGGKVDRRDIKEISSSEIPDGDVVIGGFPCQGFSVANWKRSVDDERNTLYREMVRVVRDKKPMFFLAENVTGILSLASGAVMECVVGDFAAAGYALRYEILNMADYGIPQTRRRVFILGIRKDIECDTSHFPPQQTHTKLRTEFIDLPQWITIDEALRGIPEPESSHSIKNHVCSKNKIKFNGYLGQRHTNPMKPAPTVIAGRGDNKGGVNVMVHHDGYRCISVREAAILQTFPMNFEFFGSMTSTYRQVGNAVPPHIGRVLGKTLSNIKATIKGDPNVGILRQ